MPQNYRIYINEKTLYIGKKSTSDKEKVQQLDIQNFDFKTFYKNVKKDKCNFYHLYTKDPKEVFQHIKNSCILIKAAGGLVENGNGKYLFIFRNKKWDLPKGKVEKGERMKTAAVREVEEECGVSIDRLRKKIGKTYHLYSLDGKVVLKKTNWYKMEVKGSPTLKPQKEEGITSAVWVSETEVKSKVRNTFPLIIDVLKTARVLK